MSLERTVTVVGSKPQCDVQLTSREVSGCHALVLNAGGRLYVRDLNSRTQVRHNGAAVREAYLRDGDRIAIGPYEFDVSFPADPAIAGGHRRRALRSRPRPLCLHVEGGSVPPVRLSGPVFLIGRRNGADLRIPNDRVSVAHAALVDVGGHWEVLDLNSRHGTVLNGLKVTQGQLEPGDVVSVGGVNLRISEESAAEGIRRPAVSLEPELPPTPAAMAPAPTAAAAINDQVGMVAASEAARGGGDIREQAPASGWNGTFSLIESDHFGPTAMATADAAPPADPEAVYHASGQMSALAEPLGPLPPAPVVAAPAARPRESAGDSYRTKSAPSAPATIQFKDWGPLAAAVANPQFLEAWGASRRQPAPGEAPLADDERSPSSPALRLGSSRRWLWIALALILFATATGCAVTFGYFGGWLHRWIARA